MSRNQPCALLLVCVAGGITWDRYAAVSLQFSWWLAAFAGLAMLVLRKTSWFPYSVMLNSALLITGWTALGAAWHHHHYRIIGSNEMGLFAGESPVPMELRGWIVSRPLIHSPQKPELIKRQHSEYRTKMTVRVSSLRSQGSWIPVSGKLAVTIAGCARQLSVGDEIRVTGLISKPIQKRSACDFDLREYYRTQRIHAVLFVKGTSHVRRTGRVSWSGWPQRMVCRVADWCGSRIDESFQSETASLVRAMLLGERHRVPEKIQNEFLVAGTMHLLAISGLHVGILCSAWIILIRAGWVSRRNGFLLLIGFSVFYCLLTGAKAPVLRATFLVVLFCVARISGRNPLSVNSLCLAGLAVLLANPSSLFQPGPQLSFVAVAVLIMIARQQVLTKPCEDSLTRFLKRKRSAGQRFADATRDYLFVLCISSTGIWIATIPLVAEHFHVVSFVGILTNVLLILPVSVVLNACCLAVVFGVIGLGQPFVWLAEQIFQLVLSVISLASEAPGGHWWTFGMGTRWLLLFYFVFAVLFLQTRFHVRLRWQATLALVWTTLSIGHLQFRQSYNENLSVTIIDVSHGTSVLIEFPNGKSLLYDAGSLSSSDLALQRILAVLWERRIAKLDAIVISHADLDHYNAIPKLLRRVHVGQVLYSPRLYEQRREVSVRLLLQSLQRNHVDQVVIDSSWTLNFDSACSVKILHPSPDFFGTTDNENSLVVCIHYGRQAVLLTGDIEGDGMRSLLRQRSTKIDVLLAPHHGSASANHHGMAEWCRPEYVVFSGGSNKNRADVSGVYRDQGAEVLSTATSGAIQFELDGIHVGVSPHIRPP